MLADFSTQSDCQLQDDFDNLPADTIQNEEQQEQTNTISAPLRRSKRVDKELKQSITDLNVLIFVMSNHNPIHTKKPSNFLINPSEKKKWKQKCNPWKQKMLGNW